MVFAKFASWAEQVFTPDKVVQRRFGLYQSLLREDRICLKLITRLEELYQRPIPTDWSRIALLVQALSAASSRLILCLQQMQPEAYAELTNRHTHIAGLLARQFPIAETATNPPYTLHLEEAWKYPELLGGKAMSLARILHETTIPVQSGFVVTTNAFHAFLEENAMGPIIARELRSLNLRSSKRLTTIANRLQKVVMDGRIPATVQRDMLAAMDRIAGTDGSVTWAVRSSAVAEDGEQSFAGQYTTILKVKQQDIFTAYKTVLASKYTPTALTYRLHYGLSDTQIPMAVLLLPMIDSRASGVMYSLDPFDAGQGDCLVITAIAGLGANLVDGKIVPDLFLVSRKNPDHFWAKRPAPYGGGIPPSSHRPKERRPLCLDDRAATTLAGWGLELEALNRASQDIEWTQDQSGKLFVLQSRPIQVSRETRPGMQPDDAEKDGPPPVSPTAVLLEMGTAASVGIATGPVFRLSGELDLPAVTPGCILVTSTISPSLVPLAGKVVAVLAEHGSKASHFASVAREFDLPLIVGLGQGINMLENGRLVTVDAYRGVVYDGEIDELLAWKAQQGNSPPSPFQQKMRPLMDRISPLSLLDPTSADFSPGNCRSFHDLVRFIHEKGTQEMFSLANAGGRGLHRAKNLQTEIPIVMQVLDLGQGLSEDADNERSVLPDHFLSLPMQAVWAGLADEEITWAKGLLHLDWQRFDQVSGGIFNLKTSSLLASYALVARNYAHLLLRFGYHFAVVDTLCGERSEENYIQFRFKGGGGLSEKKIWRLAMLARVLGHFGFQVHTEEDMLEAKCSRLDCRSSQLRLRILGYLLGRTPLLDIALQSEADALAMADQFIEKWRMAGNTSGVCDQSDSTGELYNPSTPGVR